MRENINEQQDISSITYEKKCCFRGRTSVSVQLGKVIDTIFKGIMLIPPVCNFESFSCCYILCSFFHFG